MKLMRFGALLGAILTLTAFLPLPQGEGGNETPPSECEQAETCIASYTVEGPVMLLGPIDIQDGSCKCCPGCVEGCLTENCRMTVIFRPSVGVRTAILTLSDVIDIDIDGFPPPPPPPPSFADCQDASEPLTASVTSCGTTGEVSRFYFLTADCSDAEGFESRHFAVTVRCSESTCPEFSCN